MFMLVHYKVFECSGMKGSKDININEHIWMDLILVKMSYTVIEIFQILIRY